MSAPRRGMKAILLGFERGVRRIDASKSYPTALRESSGRQVLDWILSALEESGIRDVVYVGGYHIEKVMERYPNLRFYYHARWERATHHSALNRVLSELDGPCLISDTDILYRSALVKRFVASKADVLLGTVEAGQTSIASGKRVLVKVRDGKVLGIASSKAADAPVYGGLMSLSARAVAKLRTIVKSPTTRPLSELLAGLVRKPLKASISDCAKDLAHAGDGREMARFVLGSKARTLERLRPLLRKAVILEQVCFSVDDWKRDADAVLRKVDPSWGMVVVRSSALHEDGWLASHAGRFETVLDVDSKDPRHVREAVGKVIESFASAGAADPRNEIFIQPQIVGVKLSGVCLTRDLETGAPYYVVNYDRTSERTETVTSGAGIRLHTLIVSKGQEPADPALAKVLAAAGELEKLIGHDALDIEFAVDRQDRCTIFQVRPIAVKQDGGHLDDADYAEEAANVSRFVREISKPNPQLHGSSTILGVMPDWNPAEIIGTCPRPLALSLYQHLITDGTWASARSFIGYRNVQPTPLMIALAGRPYIDVRASLNSFLPATVAAKVGVKLVEGGLRHLRNHPELHDKLEFEIAVTCLSFDFDEQRKRLEGFGLDSIECDALRENLLKLTDEILVGRSLNAEHHLKIARGLGERRKAILDGMAPSLESIPRMVRLLLDDCIRYGTFPFSILARFAFIATSLLKSLVARGVFTPAEFQDLLAGIPTVTSRISADVAKVGAGSLPFDQFLDSYGHLRPGTYDILSPTYRTASPKFFKGGADGQEARDSGRFDEIYDRKSGQIGKLLAESGFACTPEQLKEFIRTVIPAREEAKFEFSHNLSVALDLLADYGAKLGLTLDEVSFLPVEVFLRLGTDSSSPALKTDLQRLAGTGAKRYQVSQSVRLPHLICGESDLNSFEILEWQPNFITRSRVTAPVVTLRGFEANADLKGHVVAIESADPGYDWIFSRGIAGLVTQYGGVASHMAVRAAEFRLPAAIGCGELIFRRVARARVVELDCAARRIQVIR